MDLQDVIAQCGVQRVFRARYKLDEPGFVSHITQRAGFRGRRAEDSLLPISRQTRSV